MSESVKTTSELVTALKSGEYNGVDIMQAWCRLKELEATLAERQWIPVSERLPEYGELVVTWSLDGGHEIDYLKTSDLFTRDYPTSIVGPVTHWMPLPKEPEQP